jgi:hypothetical protein
MICNGAYWKIVYQYVCFPPSQRHSSQDDGAQHLVKCKRDGYDTLHMTLYETSSAIFCVHSISFRPLKMFPTPTLSPCQHFATDLPLTQTRLLHSHYPC